MGSAVPEMNMVTLSNVCGLHFFPPVWNDPGQKLANRSPWEKRSGVACTEEFTASRNNYRIR